MFRYELKYPLDAVITQYGRPYVVDALLTLIYMIGQSSCDALFGLKSLPLLCI